MDESPRCYHFRLARLKKEKYTQCFCSVEEVSYSCCVNYVDCRTADRVAVLIYAVESGPGILQSSLICYCQPNIFIISFLSLERVQQK